MFRQIINNLINNAIKFTNSGGIDIEVDTEKDKLIEYAVIKVKDTGIGIASKDQSLIWEEFRQASEGRSRNFEGSGLGLTITRKFVEKLNGTISVQSEIGKGSTFTIKIPIYKRLVIKENNVSYKIVDREVIPSILLVEDDPTNSQVIKFFLKNMYDVDIAQTGIESIKMAKEKDYSLILMDINLGKDMNGLTAAKEIKKIPGKKKIPIVAVTAFAMTGDKEEFLNEGLDAYIAKPFNKTQIISLIEEVLSKK
jgi:CheY-like chemotaxis protein